MLHLIESNGLLLPKECLRIASREIEYVEIVQRGLVPLAGHKVFRQGALAGLLGASNHHGRHDLQPLGERGSDDARKGCRNVDDNHSWCG